MGVGAQIGAKKPAPARNAIPIVAGNRGPTLSTAQPTSGESVTVKIGALTNSRPIKEGFR